MGKRGSYTKAALACANEMRNVLGLPPVDHLYKGIPKDSSSCPITNTVYDDDLSRDEYMVNTYGEITAYRRGAMGLEDRHKVDLTPDALQFVKKFDLGKYPRLKER